MGSQGSGSTTPKTPRQHSPSLSVNPTPCEIEFRGLGFSIAAKDGSRLPILHNVTGFCGSCRLVGWPSRWIALAQKSSCEPGVESAAPPCAACCAA